MTVLPTEARRVRFAHSDAVALAAVVGLSLVGLVGFRTSYGGSRYLVAGTIAALLGAAVAVLASRVHARLPVAALLAVAVYALVGGVVALPDLAVAGFAPSPDTISEALRLAVTGWKELITTAPPVGQTGGLMVVPVAAGFWSVFAASMFALRSSNMVLPIVPPAAVLGLSIATGVNEPASLLLQGAVFGMGAIAWLSFREHEGRPLLEASTTARTRLPAAGSLLLGVFALGFVGHGILPFTSDDRDIWRQTVTPPFDPREYPSPLSGYRRYVKQAADGVENDSVILTVEGLPADVPIRLATMDTYDGLTWQVSAGDAEAPSLDDSGSFERVGAEIAPEFDGDEVEIAITIGEYTDVWIPDVGEVIELRFDGSDGGPSRDQELAKAFRYNRATDTAASQIRLRPGDRYVMNVRLPVLMDELGGEEIEPQVPRLGVSVAATELTQALADPKLLSISDTGERLDEVRNNMTKFGTYSDGDFESGHVRSKAGHSASRLAEFVQEYPDRPLIGNAEQYAAGYALLFRDLGRVPTRVVMGFLPEAASTGKPVEVVASQVEAWVEVPVADVGWVAVFPTPPRDQTSVQVTAPHAPEPDYRTQLPPPPPLVDPEFDEPATARGEAHGTNRQTEGKAAPTGGAGGMLSSATLTRGAIVSMPLLVLGGASGVILALKRRRTHRRRTEGARHDRIAAGWCEVTDLAVDMGRPVPLTATRRESAAFVGDGAIALALRADEAVWSGGEPTEEEVVEFWAALEDYLESMTRELGLADRVKAKVSIESLRQARRGRKRALS